MSCRTLCAALIGTSFETTWGMGLIMTPSSLGNHRTVNTYVVALPDGSTAFLNSVSGRGWELIIRRGGGHTDRRGLFASTTDIMLRLEVEFNPAPVGPRWPQVERRSRPRQ
jgi:hypothetical protein